MHAPHALAVSGPTQRFAPNGADPQQSLLSSHSFARRTVPSTYAGTHAPHVSLPLGPTHATVPDATPQHAVALVQAPLVWVQQV
jgi:hypothetical protein